jgi:hypothetical protein
LLREAVDGGYCIGGSALMRPPWDDGAYIRLSVREVDRE